MNDYKFIFLDWNGTLSKSKFWGHLQKSEEGILLFNKIENVLFGQLKELLKPWMRGECKSEDICKKISELVNLPFDFIFSEFIKGCKNMEICNEEILNLIYLIKKSGSKVIIATDNMDSFTRWTYPAIQEKHNAVFDDILNSFELKALKEDVNNGVNMFFDDYIKNKKLQYCDCVLIDDSPDKNGIFSKIGMEYIQVPTTEEFIFSLRKLTKDVDV